MADIEIVLKDVQLSFANNLFVPKANKNKDTGVIESYSIETAILLDKDREDHRELIKEVGAGMKQAIADRWPSNAPIIPQERRCAQPGEITDPDTGEKVARYEGYENKIVINAKKRLKDGQVDPATGRLLVPNPVQLLGPRKTAKDSTGKPVFPVLNGTEGLLYSGARATVIIRIYAYDGSKDGNPNRVNANLEVVQFKKHGQAFGARPVDANSILEEEPDEELGDDFTSGASASAPAAAEADDLLG